MRSHRSLTFFWLILAAILLIILSQINSIAAEDKIPFQPHSLPETLEKWQDSRNSGDYFDQIEPPKVGHLVFSKFPIKVYIEQPQDPNSNQNWRELVVNSILNWNQYIPLEIIDNSENADIEIIRKRPPLDPGKTRASSAETRYQVSVKYTPENLPYLSHRFTIWLSPTQTGKYITSAAIHEFGHALGIWGHSPVESDIMYFSQVREPPPISPRDINTLKRIYQQPTRLGWPVGWAMPILTPKILSSKKLTS